MRYDSTAGLSSELKQDLVARVFGRMVAYGQVGGWSKLGLFRQVELVLLLARQNISQSVAGDLFGVSQSTVSRIWRRVLPLIDEVLPDCEYRLHEATGREATLLVDGTFVPTGNRPASGASRLNYSGYRKRQCVSIQVATDLKGTLIAVSKPVPGSRHDSTAINLSRWNESLRVGQWIADSAYISNGAITPIKRTTRREQYDWEREYNRTIATLRSPVEHAIAHLKNWKMLATGYRGPLNHLPTIIRTTSKLELYRLWNHT